MKSMRWKNRWYEENNIKRQIILRESVQYFLCLVSLSMLKKTSLNMKYYSVTAKLAQPTHAQRELETLFRFRFRDSNLNPD